MRNTLNFGVVGCGYWGPNLVRNIRLLPDCQVKWICDLDIKRLHHLKSLYSEVEPVTDYQKLLDDKELDVIVISTPVGLHHPMAMKALEAGKHTFVEKPLATTVEHCRELVELADKQKKILMVGHTFLYSSPVRKVKEIVDNGEIGDLLYISSRRLNLGLFQKDINVAWDLAPHDVSIILYIIGDSPSWVNCQGNAHVTKGIEDVVNISLNFSKKRFATIQNSWLDPRKVREMTIVGSKRMIVYDDVEALEKIKIYDMRVEVPPYYDTFAEFQYAYHYGDRYVPYIKLEEPLKVECQHLVDCIRSGDEPVSSGREGMEVVKILEATSKSLKENGAPINV